MSKPTLTLLAGYVPFVFVIPPVDFSVDKGTNKEFIQIIDMGETFTDGKRQLQRISWSGFFPNIKSNFYPGLNPLPPKACDEFLKFHMDKNTSCKLVIPEWAHFFKCKIENFTITHQDHTGDIYYTISLIEERDDISTTLDLVTGLISKITN